MNTNNNTLNILLITILSLHMGCSTANKKEEEKTPSLKEVYKDYFPIGAAINKQIIQNKDSALVQYHASSVTADNDMKYDRTVNGKGEYTFENGDQIVAFAQANNMLVRGHTLAWYHQTRDSFYQDSLGNDLSKPALLKKMQKHIHSVLNHYKGQVYCWDVVNEAISDYDDKFYRDDIKYFEIAGADYIEVAFRYAYEADSTIKLFYNDYDLINPQKREKTYQMLKELLDRGTPIHGVGMQGHYVIEDSVAKLLPLAIDRFASLGLEVQITELDVSVYPYYHNMDRSTLPKEIKPYTPEVAEALAKQYHDIFTILREKKDKITNVTFWGIADNRTWLSHYVVKGRTDYPLLFDQDLLPKKAFYKVTDFK
ncbi:endo-1,4-beta-xylanase [Reichenbachiella carrageenanivorans]|uniref:Beta-xylanase n=1 Tax=Reichenbachiella carrageenanivorans TaxID=2979869 RepID=A0ABY6D4P4_9BACT|nr:endo-1,4-beta-xylanase [Reichenbachiella carrageenanivorans]UXX80779.1 endo-1,4-beta-xylanase [Reichenbachiella carrageenanivorans]